MINVIHGMQVEVMNKSLASIDPTLTNSKLQAVIKRLSAQMEVTDSRGDNRITASIRSSYNQNKEDKREYKAVLSNLITGYLGELIVAAYFGKTDTFIATDHSIQSRPSQIRYDLPIEKAHVKTNINSNNKWHLRNNDLSMYLKAGDNIFLVSVPPSSEWEHSEILSNMIIRYRIVIKDEIKFLEFINSHKEGSLNYLEMMPILKELFKIMVSRKS